MGHGWVERGRKESMSARLGKEIRKEEKTKQKRKREEIGWF